MAAEHPPIITGKVVRLAMRDTIEANIREFLDVVGIRDGRAAGDLPVFRSYVSAFDTDKFDEDQVPACIIVAPGLIGEPRRRGVGKYEATWSVAVAAIVSGQNPENTFELVELYAAAIRAAVINKRALGGVATGTDWLNERYDELSSDDIRTIAAGIVQFAVTVETIVDDRGALEEILATDVSVDAMPEGSNA